MRIKEWDVKDLNKSSQSTLKISSKFDLKLKETFANVSIKLCSLGQPNILIYQSLKGGL